MHHVHHRIFVPGRWVFGIAAQSFAKVPVIGERTDIDSAAHASCRPEDILVPESQVKRPVSPHAESGYGPSFRTGERLIFLIHPTYQLLGNVGFITECRIFRTIEIPAAESRSEEHTSELQSR